MLKKVKKKSSTIKSANKTSHIKVPNNNNNINKHSHTIPKGAGTPLLDLAEISKLDKARQKDEKKRESKIKKGKKLNGKLNGNSNVSNSNPRKSKKKRKTKKGKLDQ
eukprot:263716_1